MPFYTRLAFQKWIPELEIYLYYKRPATLTPKDQHRWAKLQAGAGQWVGGQGHAISSAGLLVYS